MSIYDIAKKAMSSHRGTWYSDREVLGMILKFENPQPMTSERKLSDEVCKCYKTFIVNTKNSQCVGFIETHQLNNNAYGKMFLTFVEQEVLAILGSLKPHERLWKMN